MKSSDELFVLIKSMDRNEKGYFRKFSGIHGSKRQGNYLRLFDCIAAMDTYDEAKVREAFKGEKFLTQLGVTKLYLRNLIIKSLRNYVNETDPGVEMLNAITEVSLLYKRRLYDSALKLVNKTKKLASQREAHLELLFLLRLEYYILTSKGDHYEVVKSAERRIEEEYECMRLYQNSCDYKKIQGLIANGLQIEGMGPGGSAQKIKDYLNHPLLLNEDMALSFRSKCIRLDILSKCYLKAGDKEMALQIAYQNLALYQNNPEQIKMLPINYLNALDHLVTRCIINHKYDEALKYIDMSGQLLSDPKVHLDDIDRHEILFTNSLEKVILYAKSGQFKKSMAAYDELLGAAKKSLAREDVMATANYFYAWSNLATGRYEEALKLVNNLIHDESPKARKDTIVSAYGMNIIIHYELGNYSIIKRLLKMLHNYIVANKFPETGWPGFVKIMNEITEAKINDNHKDPKKKFYDLSLVMKNYDFLEIALMTWWVNNKLKQK